MYVLSLPSLGFHKLKIHLHQFLYIHSLSKHIRANHKEIHWTVKNTKNQFNWGSLNELLKCQSNVTLSSATDLITIKS